MAKKHFGAWQRQPYAPVIQPVEPPQRGARENGIKFATDLTRISLGWPIPGDAHPDKPALDVLAFLLGSGLQFAASSRTARPPRAGALRVGRRVVVSQCGLFSVDADCQPG